MLIGLVLYLLTAHPAQADDTPLLGKHECRYVTEHQPAADVEYVPGKDVHGKPVVEAEIDPSPVAVPEKYSFDITVDTAKYMGLNVPAGVEGKVVVGTVTVDHGKLFYNGKPMQGEAQAALQTLCTPKPAVQHQDKKANYNQ